MPRTPLKTVIRFATPVLSLLTLSTGTLADVFTDNFESVAPGTFPSGNWSDTGPISPYSQFSAPPSPSCTVGVTTDAFGQPTRALHLDGSWTGSASGIYRSIAPATQFTVAMDVRTDTFGAGATDNPSDWPWMMGVSQYDANTQAGGWRSLQMYGTDLSQDFRGYAIYDQGQADFPLGVVEQAGVWYHIQIDLDADQGIIRNRIWNATTSALLADTTVNAAGWLPSDNVFDCVTINQGELSALTSSDAWVDNVTIGLTPEPASLLMLAVGGMGFARRRDIAANIE